MSDHIHHSFTINFLFGGRNEFCNRHRQEINVLEYSRKERIVILNVIIRNGVTVQLDLALGGVIKAAHQFNESCFTRTVRTDNSKFLALADFQIDILQRAYFTVRRSIFEGYVIQLNIYGQLLLGRHRAAFSVIVLFFDLKILPIVADLDALVGNIVHHVSYAIQPCGEACDRTEIEHEITCANLVVEDHYDQYRIGRAVLDQHQ